MQDNNSYINIDRYIDRLITESTPDLPIWNIESIRQGKKPHWNYIDGCMITSLLQMNQITGDKKYFDFAERFIDYYVSGDGSILGYNVDKYNLDDLNEGRVLFELYRRTGKEKYRLAIENQKKQLDGQPRTNTGNFWHKLIYPNQIWLDGIYMAQVFSTLYSKEYGGGDYSDMLSQIENVNKYMQDESSGLYYHGLDCSKSIFWADSASGLSKNFWLRSIGWFTVALIDIIEIVDNEEVRSRLEKIFADLINSIAKFRDSSGLYWQVVDQPGREGNYLETSGSSMIAYAMLKGARLGVIDAEYALLGKSTFDGICDRYLTVSEGGELNLGGICLVAGLGPENNRRRDGSYEYYISEPIVENDAKGVAPFVLCYTEILRTRG
ncbi:MAG: glycoside hydrolase family 88 protein [Clostridia bacterium]|nr:glycoside hydrolase family 88 protein [Clostridia bacterium]